MLERYSRRVPLAEIEKNDDNLNIPRYIDASEPEDIHDLIAYRLTHHHRTGHPLGIESSGARLDTVQISSDRCGLRRW